MACILFLGLLETECKLLDGSLRIYYVLCGNCWTNHQLVVEILTSSKFPLKFCPTKWVENVSVATRAIELRQDYVTLIIEFLLRCASKRPQNNVSYNALLKHHT